jgi:UDP-N-acetylglucosamine 1-carboxyvinyltransferase
MDKMMIHGGAPLRGSVSLSGSKNAALPIMMASLLTAEPLKLTNVPRLRDVKTAMDLLIGLGVEARWTDDHAVELRAANVTSHEASYELVKTMRASFVVLGPLLARTGRARVSTPGGCAIGARPVNLHISGIRSLGSKIQFRHGYVEAHAEKLVGARIWLDSPSVGATENILMAAVTARGRTLIENAAREPEVQDLAKVLAAMGAKISGAGTHVIEIEGVERLHGASHAVISDRIEAGSMMAAAAITGGDVTISNAPVEHLEAVVVKLREAGVSVESNGAHRQTAARRIAHAAVSRLPDRSAGTDDGTADAGRRHFGNHRNDFRKSFHARSGTRADGRRYRNERADRRGPRALQAERSARDGDRLARQHGADNCRPRRRTHH